MGSQRNWTEKEIDILSDNYGVVSDEQLAVLLGRTITGIRQAARRHLKICHQANFFTARRLAEELGVG